MANREEFCPIVAATDLLGQKWTLLIVHFLHTAHPQRLLHGREDGDAVGHSAPL